MGEQTGGKKSQANREAWWSDDLKEIAASKVKIESPEGRELPNIEAIFNCLTEPAAESSKASVVESPEEKTENDFNPIKNSEQYEKLDEAIAQIRIDHIDTESEMLDDTRVFKTKSGDSSDYLDVAAVFSRGIDIFRATAAILHYHELDLNKKDNTSEAGRYHDNLKALLSSFHKQMSSIARLNSDEAFPKAVKCCKKFNRALASYLMSNNVVRNDKNAFRSISFMRDVLWKSKANPFISSATQDEKLSYIVKRTPLRFQVEDDAIWKDGNSWMEKLRSRFDNQYTVKNQEISWFDHFSRSDSALWKNFKTQSSTSTSRATPNPANATWCESVYFPKNSDASPLVRRKVMAAITEPYEMKREQRKEATIHNHKQLFSANERLESYAKDYYDRWKGVLSEGETIQIPLVHQTLIADGINQYINPDAKKSGTLLKNKHAANQAVQKELKDKKVHLNIKTGAVEFDKKDAELDGDFVKVQFNLMETNHCINGNHFLSQVRPSTVTTGKTLNQLSINFLEKNIQQDSMKEDLKIVTSFLKKPDVSLLWRNLKPSKKVIAAMEAISCELTQDPKADNSNENRNLAMLLESAVSYKCAMHDNLMGRFISGLNNDLLSKIPVVGQILKVGTVALQAAYEMTIGLPDQVADFSQGTGRRSYYRALYESHVMGCLGTIGGGCMSTTDRAEELRIGENAGVSQFVQEGKLLGFWASRQEREQSIKTHASNAIAQQAVYEATGVGARKIPGLRGLGGALSYLPFVLFSKKSEQKQKMMATLRKAARSSKKDFSSEWREFEREVIGISSEGVRTPQVSPLSSPVGSPQGSPFPARRGLDGQPGSRMAAGSGAPAPSVESGESVASRALTNKAESTSSRGLGK